ncbi:hypothetical protein BSZ19_13400 [Bradyrhizobium japonicum]|uniref:Uncharacterized protein n=1 Tax=Bradyrhizobium japonicum TaxID=375 RepID=A0A1Y2JRJ8_BRAJP|nr:hypothetical protein BSZ19_13400 [Bradyrhizobium japonicum]
MGARWSRKYCWTASIGLSAFSQSSDSRRHVDAREGANIKSADQFKLAITGKIRMEARHQGVVPCG